jgi:hypothetical protein
VVSPPTADKRVVLLVPLCTVSFLIYLNVLYIRTICRFCSHCAALVIGVMNAADYYGLDELRRACAGFVQCCINVDTVCALLASAERYIQYKCTKSLVQKVTNSCS